MRLAFIRLLLISFVARVSSFSFFSFSNVANHARWQARNSRFHRDPARFAGARGSPPRRDSVAISRLPRARAILFFASVTAVLLAAATPGAAGFIKQTNQTLVNATIDWSAPGIASPATSDCLGGARDGYLCNGDAEGKGRAPNATGNPDACSDFNWETGHGNVGGIYSAVRQDGLGPRGAGRPYWAVCVKDTGNVTSGRNSTATSTVRYAFNLDDYVPRNLVIYSADLALDYTVDAGDFDEGSRAVLYGFIRDLDTGLYYKIRGDQSRGNAAPGITNGGLGGWNGCDYLDVWDSRADNSTGNLSWNSTTGSWDFPGACGMRGGSAKASPRMEASRNRTFSEVCANGTPDISLGQGFGYPERCYDAMPLATFLNSKAATSRGFELLFRLVVQLTPGAGGSEKFALTFDDPVFIKAGSPKTPRYGASFAYGATVSLDCTSTSGGTITFAAQDQNRLQPEFPIATVTDGGGGDLDPAAGRVATNWVTTPPVNGINYMTGWWVRCSEAGQPSDYTKVYLVNNDPEVYLRGRAYYTYLPNPTGYTSVKGNGEASNGDHDEDNAEYDGDQADEPGKLWYTVKLGKRASSGGYYGRFPVSGAWGEGALAQTAFLGCWSENNCAAENSAGDGSGTAGSFRLAQWNQQGDNLAHSPSQDLNGDGYIDLSPCYNRGSNDAAGDYDTDFGRGYAGASSGNGCSSTGTVGPYSGSDSDTDARVPGNCWTAQPPSIDGTHSALVGGLNDCQFMQGRWAKFLFGAASFRGDATQSADTFWWTVGLWLDDKNVFAFGQNANAAACVPSKNTNHGFLGFITQNTHFSCIPTLGDTPTPEASIGIKLWIANTVDGCDSWTTCKSITSLGDYVNRSVTSWNRFLGNFMDDLGNFSETYPSDGGPTSITALGTQFLKVFGEPANPRYQEVGGSACSTSGIVINPPSNPAGIFWNLIRTTINANQASGDPASLGVDAAGCVYPSAGDLRPPARDGAALTLPAASYLIQDKRDQWFLRVNDAGTRPNTEAMFRNITLNYAKAIGPSNGSNGFNYFIKGLIGADPKAWTDALMANLENGRDFKFFGGVVLNEQMARAFNPLKGVQTARCMDVAGGPSPSCTSQQAWDDPNTPSLREDWGVNPDANNKSTVGFLTATLDLVTQGLQQYNLMQKQFNDLNPALIKSNAEAKWGFTYWFLKLFNTYLARMPQDKFNASLEEKTRWVAISNYGNPGWVDYMGVSRGQTGGCGNWIYQRSTHTASSNNNDNVDDYHNHDGTAYTDNANAPFQFRPDAFFGLIDSGNPVKQDAGSSSIDTGYNYLLCRLQYVNDETYKNLADTLLETIGYAYKSYWAMTRYGQNAVPAVGEEPTVSDVSTELVRFLTQWLDYYRVRPTRLLYDNSLFQESTLSTKPGTDPGRQQSDSLAFPGNNDYYFDNVQQVVINGQPAGRFSCNDGTASAQRCRDRYYYEKEGYSLFLYKLGLKILNNIDFGPTGAFYNLTRLRVERAADLAGDPQGAVNGLTYALNYGRNVDPVVRQQFAQTITDYVPLYLRARFDAADQDFRLAPEQRLDFQTTKTKLQTFGARWLGDWADLMFNLRGAKAEYYNCGTSCAGNPFPEPVYAFRTDDNASFDWGSGSPDPSVLPSDGFSARWTFKLNVLSARNYTIQYCWDGGINLTIDGNKRSTPAQWSTPQSPFACSTTALDMSAGLHDFLVEYYDDSGPARVDLQWNLSGTCCQSIPKERYYPPYPYDYTFKAAGAGRWIFALFNTIYESFTPAQNIAIAKAIAQNLSRYFGDEDGCSGQTGVYHTQIGRQNFRCGTNPNGVDSGDPLAYGIDPAVVREQHEVTTRALGGLFKALGLSLQQLPSALPDPSATTNEGIVFLRHATEAVKNVMDQINALPITQKNITYDRYWAREMWALRSFQYFVNIGGGGVMAGPIKVSATPGQIGSAGAALASNLDSILGDPQARSGLNYLITSLRVQDESQLQTFTSDLLSFLLGYVKFQAERSVRFPAVFLPSARANTSMQEYSRLNLFQKANGTLGLRYLLDPVNQISGLWGAYYNTSAIAGTLYVASDDGAACRLTNGSGSTLAINALSATRAIFSDADNTYTDQWDNQSDVSNALGPGPVLLTCQIRNAGGNAGFDSALKVGARFRIQRSDNDANYHVTLSGTAPQIPGCTQDFTGNPNCATKNYDCSKSERWFYATAQPGWWPASDSTTLGSINNQDLSGTSNYAPFTSTAETWGCTNPMSTAGGSDFFAWKRVDIDPFEDGRLTLYRNDPVVDFNWGTGSPGTGLGADSFSVRWTGKLQVPTSRNWNLTVCANDGFRLSVDGVKLVDQWTDTASGTTQCGGWSGYLEAALHDIQLDYYERGGTSAAQLMWNLTGGFPTCNPTSNCQIIGNSYLYTRDPAQYNRSAQSFFGIVYGWSGALNALYAIASKAAIQDIYNTMSTRFPDYWGSFGGAFGRSYNIRSEAGNSSLDSLRDDYAKGTISTYRNLITLAGKVGEQAPFALPNATAAGFVRMWDMVPPTSPNGAELGDLATLACNGLSSSAKKAYYFGEDNYPESWTTKAFRINVRNYLNVGNPCGAAFANLTTAADLATAMRNNGTDSVIVMLKDVCPDTVCDTPLPNAVVYYDTKYPTSWIGAPRNLSIANFLNQTGAASPANDPRNPTGVSCTNQTGPSAPCGRTFVRYDATQLAYWMRNATARDKARGSVAVFSQDVCPDTVCENLTVNNTIARYLAAGGRVVWVGDIPFYYQGRSDGTKVAWGTIAQEKILGVNCRNSNGTPDTADCFTDPPYNFSAVTTPAATTWGLTQGWGSARPVSYVLKDSNFVGKYWNFFNSGVYSSAPTATHSDNALDFWFWRNCPQWNTNCGPGDGGSGATQYDTTIHRLRPGAGTPDRRITNLDNWASEWTGTFYQPVNGTVTFTSTGDDSRAVRVDSTIVTDANGLFSGAASCTGDTNTRTGTIALVRGLHTITYRQCEATGNAAAELTISGPGWPGTVGIRPVRPALPPGTTPLAYHPRTDSYPTSGPGTLLTNVSAFFRNYNPVFPDSGFVRIWDCSPGTSCGWDLTGNPADARLRDLWNVSTFNLTVEVHAGELGTGNVTGSPFRTPDINMAGNDSLLADYLRRGGRVVWVGDTPMFQQGHAGTSPNSGNLSRWDYGGEKKLLGVRTSDPYSTGQQSSRSWEGVSSLGLSSDVSITTDSTLRPAYARDVTYVFRKDSKENASWWMKEVNDSIVTYKRRTTEFRTHVLEELSRFLTALQNAGDWEGKLSTYWADRYWVQQGAIATYKAWLRQSDLLRQMGTDLVNASVTLLGKNESQGISYIWRAELTVDWTTGRGPWGRALLDYGNNWFGFQTQTMWNASAGIRGLGVNTTLRSAELAVNSRGPLVPGQYETWTGVSQS